jgi:hypothetical protein
MDLTEDCSGKKTCRPEVRSRAEGTMKEDIIEQIITLI